MTVLFCGVGLIAAGFAVIVFRSIAGGIVVDQLVNEESVKPAAEAGLVDRHLADDQHRDHGDRLRRPLRRSPAGSPRRPARRRQTRRFLTPVLRDYSAYVYAGLAIVVCIYFLSAPTQNLRSFLTTLVLAGLAAFGIHELRRQSERENPDVPIERPLRGSEGPRRPAR